MADTNTPASNAAIAEIDLGPSKLDQFLDNHQSKLIIFAILVALAVVAYVIYSGLEEGKAQEAGSAVVAAESAEEYKSVISQWPATNSAATSQLLLADSQWKESSEASITTLQEFIDTNPQHLAVATAQVSLGLKLIDQGKNSDAIEILSQVAESNSASYLTSLAHIALGDIAKIEGDTEKAKTHYESAQNDSSLENDAFNSIAATRLILVNAQPPVKIQPALPEPPAPPAIDETPEAAVITPVTPTIPAVQMPETPVEIIEQVVEDVKSATEAEESTIE